ncbi:MAG: hypothetical protein Q4D21_10420 [Phascolarctobacterium sp.]|nr:hypothetical protein [Phascolarctobacterium sp.]
MNFKKIKMLMALTMCSCISFGATAFAKANIDISWTNGPAINCAEHSKYTQILADDNVLKEIGKAVNDRIMFLSSSGQLPFNLKTVSTAINNDLDFKENYQGEIVILPLVLNDFSLEHTQFIDGVPHQKSIITTDINIAFCAVDGNELRVLHIVPLSGHTMLGHDGAYRNVSAIPLADLKAEYMRATKKLITENLNFADGKYLKQLETKTIDANTYQVADVNLLPGNSVVNVAQNFEADPCVITNALGERMAKSLIALSFTSKYAQLFPDKSVLPFNDGNNWVLKAGALTGAMGESSMKIVVGQGANPINITLEKTALFEKPLTTKTYRRISCGAKTTIGQVASLAVVDRDFVRSGNNTSQFEWDDLLTELLHESGKVLAEEYAKKNR